MGDLGPGGSCPSAAPRTNGARLLAPFPQSSLPCSIFLFLLAVESIVVYHIVTRQKKKEESEVRAAAQLSWSRGGRERGKALLHASPAWHAAEHARRNNLATTMTPPCFRQRACACAEAAGGIPAVLQAAGPGEAEGRDQPHPGNRGQHHRGVFR